jgi:hypothetical protein
MVQRTKELSMSDSTLPAYTGTAARCTKCTCPTIDDTYRPNTPHLTWNSTGDLAEITTHEGHGPECLLRTCRDCGWAWLEQCADAQAAE